MDADERLRRLPLFGCSAGLRLGCFGLQGTKAGGEVSDSWRGKTNNTAFNLALDGKWHCFSCENKRERAARIW